METGLDLDLDMAMEKGSLLNLLRVSRWRRGEIKYYTNLNFKADLDKVKENYEADMTCVYNPRMNKSLN